MSNTIQRGGNNVPVDQNRYVRSGELSGGTTRSTNATYGSFDSDFFTKPGNPSKREQQIGGLLGKLGNRTLVSGTFSKEKDAFSKSGAYNGKNVQGQYSVKLGELSAKGSGSISTKNGALIAKGELDARAALLDAQASGHVKLGSVEANGSAYAFVGAKAHADGSLTIDPKNGVYAAQVGGEAFVGAKAGVSGDVKLGKFGSVGGTAEAWAGVGAQFRAQVGYKDGKFSARVDIGAALGIGFKLGFNVNIDVKGIVNKAKEIIAKPVEVIKNVGKSIGNAIKKLKFW
jgi:hypothetical protein